MKKQYNTRPNLRGKYERTDLVRLRLTIAHARNRQDKLAFEAQTNKELLEKLLQREKELANGEVL